MAKDYVEQFDGGYRIIGTRVSLESVIYGFVSGSSPESISESFPVLRLEEVYGAIAYYLAHQSEIDACLRSHDRQFDQLRRASQESNPLLYRKLEEARHLHSSRS